MAENGRSRSDKTGGNKSFDLLWLFHYCCIRGQALGLTRNRKTQSTGQLDAVSATDGIAAMALAANLQRADA
jgi:hypothetical protein